MAYAIGVAEPVGLYVNTFGTSKVDFTDGEIAEKLHDIFDMKPYAIEQRFKLRTPIYSETAAYGHMGRNPKKVTKTFVSPDGVEKTIEVELFPWEKLNYVEKIKLNQSVSIISEGNKDNVIGKIKRINRKVDEMTQTVKIFIEFNNRNLFEGKFVEIKVPLGVIPESQLISRSLLINDRYVFVANKDDKISKAYVQPLFYNKKNVIVTGLDDGTRLITSNVSGIYEGMKIKVVQRWEELLNIL